MNSNPKEIERAFFQHSDIIHGYLSRITGSESADDLLQESFARAIASWSDFRGDASVKNWLFRIASNVAFDTLRKRKYINSKFITAKTGNIIGLDLDASGAFSDIIDNRPWNMPDEQADRNEMIECISDFVNSLQPKFRTIIILREINHISVEDISEILSLSPQNVRVRLHRAREALKKSLMRECHVYQGRNGVLQCEKNKKNQQNL